MITYTRFKLQRTIRRFRRKTTRWWRDLRHTLQVLMFGRSQQLAMVRRFVIGWWLVILVAGGGLFIQTRHLWAQGTVLRGVQGGSYSEAVVGSVRTINPVLPEGSASADAVHLVFSGLTRFNPNGELVGDLAQNWTISPDGKTYTFALRHGVRWHDDVPFTAQDVIFTLAAIQNPDTRSPLAASWQGVKVSAPDDYTAVFTLPKPYAPFIDATTVGILPRHLLENTDPAALRVSQFNQKPIGTGPYKLDTLDTQAGEVRLSANPKYYFGRPLIDAVTLRLYADYAKAFDAYSHRQVQGVARLQPDQLDEAAKLGTMKIYTANVPDEVAVFFKTTSPVLQDKVVRQALAQATDRKSIVHKEFKDQAVPLASPLLASDLPITGATHQPGLDVAKAEQALDAAGWKRGKDGIRSKDGVRLEIKLVTQSNSSYVPVAKLLEKQWRVVGAKLNITEVDAQTLQQSYIRPRNYDAILYGINVGADPDVYAYWDSSQAKDPGLNLSVYSSKQADAALESGRIISDREIRAAKYRSFIQTWVNDTPAVMLYTPSYDYGVDSSVHGVSLSHLVNPADRFGGIEKWSVRMRSVPR